MSDNQENQKTPAPKQYRIGDYARYMCVGRDFLKHYEKAGLLDAVHEDNGYRHFDFRQSSRILECMRLRNCGFAIREMGEMFELSAQDCIRSVESHREALEQEIRRKQAIAAAMSSFQEWFARRHGQTDEWEITQEEGRCFLPHSDGLQFLEDDRIYEILPQWLEWLPVVKSTLKFTPCLRGEKTFGCQWGLSVSASEAKKYGIPLNDAVQIMKPRKIFRYHFGGLARNHALARLADGTSPFYTVLEQHNLRMSGDGFMDIFMTANRAAGGEEYGIIRIPVETDNR